MLKKIIYLLLLLSLILNIFLFSKTKKSGQGILVIGVIDGDTLVLDGKVKLRLRNIDAPELEFCKGQEVKDFLEKLTKGKRITIEEKILDQRGRAMALVYISGILVNEEILKNGLGRYHHDQSTQAEKLKQAADLAKKQQRGIFGPECYQMKNLEQPKCNIKGNIDKNSGARKYYFPGCVQYEFTIVEKDIGEQWFCTEKEAQAAGFIKSERCPSK